MQQVEKIKKLMKKLIFKNDNNYYNHHSEKQSYAFEESIDLKKKNDVSKKLILIVKYSKRSKSLKTLLKRKLSFDEINVMLKKESQKSSSEFVVTSKKRIEVKKQFQTFKKRVAETSLLRNLQFEKEKMMKTHLDRVTESNCSEEEFLSD